MALGPWSAALPAAAAWAPGRGKARGVEMPRHRGRPGLLELPAGELRVVSSGRSQDCFLRTEFCPEQKEEQNENIGGWYELVLHREDLQQNVLFRLFGNASSHAACGTGAELALLGPTARGTRWHHYWGPRPVAPLLGTMARGTRGTIGDPWPVAHRGTIARDPTACGVMGEPLACGTKHPPFTPATGAWEMPSCPGASIRHPPGPATSCPDWGGHGFLLDVLGSAQVALSGARRGAWRQTSG